jgi:undecaprenyl-diphosphatase
VFASGLTQIPDILDPGAADVQGSLVVVPSIPQMIVATLVAFALGYASIAWLLRFVENHTIYVFVWYRVILGLIVLLAVSNGVVPAT